MKQKLALCCTLMHRPELLFLDEPTTGVDPVSRRDLWRILYRLSSEGLTIVVSTPYMDEAERCGRIAMMNAGRIVREGTPAELKASLPGAMLEVRSDEQRRAIAVLREAPGVLNVRQFGDRLRAHVSGAERAPDVQAALTGAGIPAEVHPVPPGLEDAFVAVIEADRAAEGAESA
jgi:ABC-2 type transport system ATP-binding protein